MITKRGFILLGSYYCEECSNIGIIGVDTFMAGNVIANVLLENILSLIWLVLAMEGTCLGRTMAELDSALL